MEVLKCTHTLCANIDLNAHSMSNSMILCEKLENVCMSSIGALKCPENRFVVPQNLHSVRDHLNQNLHRVCVHISRNLHTVCVHLNQNLHTVCVHIS